MATTWIGNPGRPCCEEGCEDPYLFLVLDCATLFEVAGAVVTVTDADDDEIGSGTTDGAGQVEIAIAATGHYTATIEAAGYPTFVLAFDFDCIPGAGSTVTLGGTYTVVVEGCGCALPGATVTITQTAGGTFAATGTTDSAGVAAFDIPITYLSAFDVEASAPDYIADGITTGWNAGAPFDCAPTGSITLESDPDYFCFGGDPPICRGPIPATLSVTYAADPSFGALSGQTVTVAYQGASFVPPNGITYRYLGCASTGGGVYRGVDVDIGNADRCTAPSGGVNTRTNALSDCSDASIPPGVTHTISSGTAACPVAFTATRVGYGSITVSE